MKKFRRIASLLLALVLALSMTVNVFAAEEDGSVIYEGLSKQFIFAPGSEYSPTDLFTNFKGVMPGDTLTEQIVLSNAESTEYKVQVYMRALGAQEGTDDFLSQMTLTVQKNGDAVLFEAPANETAQLTEWVSLGTVAPGGEVTLDVTLNVPIEMGNDFAQQIGYLDWQFKIEEIPVPETGDDMKLGLYGGVAALSLLVLVALVVLYRRKRSA